MPPKMNGSYASSSSSSFNAVAGGAAAGSIAIDNRKTARTIKDDNEDDTSNDSSTSHGKQRLSTTSNTAHSIATTSNNNDSNSQNPEIPRTGRACLACRKLKTRCEDSETAPCKRCKAGGHECIFVESKRGKRPPRNKPTDAVLAEKFRTVEKSLSTLLNTMSSGATPDPATLQQLQASLQEGLAANTNNSGPDGTSPGSSNDARPGQNKRARVDSTATSTASQFALPSPVSQSPFINTVNLSPASASSGHLSARPLDFTPKTTETPLPPVTAGTSLNVLADASLAAQIEGRSKITGIEPGFALNSITEAIARDENGNIDEARTPSILSKGIITPETAVEMFRLFFDWAYIHMPILDPVYNSATSVCARSPFLFTAICAVASRFNVDPTLHIRCYDEAHAQFLEMIATGERSIESVQACMILTVWGSAPKGQEDRPQRAYLYHGFAVRVALEIGLFRPPAFVDAHLATTRSKANPWINIKNASEDEQREALNRERTWLMIFVMDRNISAVVGRPYQVQEAKPLLLPAHPMSLPFDLGVIAHQELQTIVGQVMDTFRDRLYGLPSASDEMPSPTVMKIFNSRMDEWQQRWCPVPGEPIANNLLFYFFSSKLFLNSIPLHTMLRNGEGNEDVSSVSSTINAAKSILQLGHEYAILGVLLHCLDVNFLLLLYGAVFLVKVKVSNTRFAELVDSDELQALLLQTIADCQAATSSDRHAASTCYTLLRALFASWKAMSQAAQASQHGSTGLESRRGSQQIQYGADHLPRLVNGPGSVGASGSPPSFTSPGLGPSLGLHGTLAGPGLPPSGPTSPAAYPFLHTPFASKTGGGGGGYFGTTASGANTPMASHHHVTGPNATGTTAGNGTGVNAGMPGSHIPGPGSNTSNMEPLDSFLIDTNFFNGLMTGQGAEGFFSWPEGIDAAGGLDLSFGPFDPVAGVGGGSVGGGGHVGDVSFE